MKVSIVHAGIQDRLTWDAYVMTHKESSLYQLYGWRTVIEKTYGNDAYYLMAVRDMMTEKDRDNGYQKVAGILPLVHLKHFLFGNGLISIPYFDISGILADDPLVVKALLTEAANVGRKLEADTIELRHTHPIDPDQSETLFLRSHKVRMLLRLPDTSRNLMDSFKSKLRSQVKKPIKEGLYSRIGGIELLNDFYNIFSENMRDLGSPVHSKRLMSNVLYMFPDQAKIIIIYDDGTPVAASMIIGFKDVLENPWASSLRQFSRKSPNMLLYWTMLEFACDHGYRFFDFGRSTPDEGTYNFKAQWGAEPQKLYWYYITMDGRAIQDLPDEKSKFDKAIQYWQKLPLPVTKLFGPMIRKRIGL
jgi:FemAB-related protein (PEP-CTERM system-associated)